MVVNLMVSFSTALLLHLVFSSSLNFQWLFGTKIDSLQSKFFSHELIFLFSSQISSLHFFKQKTVAADETPSSSLSLSPSSKDLNCHTSENKIAVGPHQTPLIYKENM